MNRGLIIGTDGNKMSKSKGNVVDPDVHVERVGADSVKMYLAFIAPFNEVGAHPWNTGGIAGIRRFLERVTRLVSATEETSQTLETALHKTIAKVETDINQFKFNTAISALMSFVNLAEKEGITSPQFEVLLKLLAPFAPHLTEELWESLGHTTSIHLEHWPEYKSELLKDTELIIAVQVNSKVRDNIQIKSGSSEEDVTKKAIESTKIQKWLDGKTPKRVVYVEGRLINLIV